MVSAIGKLRGLPGAVVIVGLISESNWPNGAGVVKGVDGVKDSFDDVGDDELF